MGGRDRRAGHIGLRILAGKLEEQLSLAHGLARLHRAAEHPSGAAYGHVRRPLDGTGADAALGAHLFVAVNLDVVAVFKVARGQFHRVVRTVDRRHTALALVVLIVGLIEIDRFAHVDEAVVLVIVGAGCAGVGHLRKRALDAGNHPVEGGHVLAQVAGVRKHRLHGAVHRGVNLDRIQREQCVARQYLIAGFQIKGQQHAGIRRRDLVDVFTFRHRVGGDAAHSRGLHILRQGAQRREQGGGQQQSEHFFHG